MAEIKQEYNIEQSKKMVDSLNKLRSLEFTNKDVIEFSNILMDYLGYDEKPEFSVKEINPKDYGRYFRGEGVVVAQRLVDLIKGGAESFIELVDTITHEITHYFQDMLDERHGEEIKENEDPEYRKILAEFKNYGDVDANSLQDVVDFLNKYKSGHTIKLEGFPINQSGYLSELAFGLYLQNKCEESARSGALKQTTTLYSKLLQDPNCPKDLQQWIATNQLEELKLKAKEEIAKREKYYFDSNMARRTLELSLYEMRDILYGELSERERNSFYKLMQLTISRNDPIQNFNLLKATMLKGVGMMSSYILEDTANRSNSKELLFVKEQIFKTMKEESFADPWVLREIIDRKLLTVEQQFALAEQFLNEGKTEYLSELFSAMSNEQLESNEEYKQKIDEIYDKSLTKFESEVARINEVGFKKASLEDIFKMEEMFRFSLVGTASCHTDRADEFTQRCEKLFEQIASNEWSVDNAINERNGKELELKAKNRCSEYHNAHEDEEMSKDELQREQESALRVEQLKLKQKLLAEIEKSIYGDRYAYGKWDSRQAEIDSENLALDNIRHHVVVPVPTQETNFENELDALLATLSGEKQQEQPVQDPIIKPVKEDIMGL